MEQRLTILNKDREEKRQRQELVAAAASDVPSTQAMIEAHLGMQTQIAKLSAIEARLERMAANAEAQGAAASVAQLSGQQLRGVEVGAKLGAVGGYKPPSAIPQTSERNIVSIEFVFQNAPPETIALAGRPVIDGDLTDPDPEVGVPSPSPKQKFHGSVSDYWDFSKPGSDEDAKEG
jgi:hypothetical protein